MMHCLSIPTSMQLRTLCIVCQFWCETLTSRSLGTLPSTVLVYTGMCCTWSAYQSQHSIQSHDTWSMWLMGKFKISVWIECEPEVWKVRTEREVSWETSAGIHQNRNRGCRKVASLTLPSFARLPCDVMAGFTWLIKFLGDKLLYGHVPDHFPQCGIVYGHVRVQECKEYIIISIMIYQVQVELDGLIQMLLCQYLKKCLLCMLMCAYIKNCKL